MNHRAKKNGKAKNAQGPVQHGKVHYRPPHHPLKVQTDPVLTLGGLDVLLLKSSITPVTHYKPEINLPKEIRL